MVSRKHHGKQNKTCGVVIRICLSNCDHGTYTNLPDCMWNYSCCELMDLGVEIDDDWHSVGNINLQRVR
jgi:hypothetical protein